MAESTSNYASSVVSINDQTQIQALKLSLYMTLKNLHDKWLTSYNAERFQVLDPIDERRETLKKFNGVTNSNDGITSEFSNFIYVDSFYNDIGDKMLINPQTMFNYIKDHRDNNKDANMSAYQIMNKLCADNKLLFITLPIFNNYGSKDTIVEMFKPNPDTTMRVGDSSTYVVMYTHNISHTLRNTDKDKFRQDGFDIADVTGRISPEAITLFKHETLENGETSARQKYDIIVPAFGVTYARQNQSMFKNITVNMESPKLTDFSIANMFKIAKMTNAGGANEVRTTQAKSIAQDAYAVFANQSYTCTVEMLGCMNIMPMMYFQLNNTPMFRGAYMIISVKHSIKAGQMTTTFTGVRVSKIRKPFVEDAFLLSPYMSDFFKGKDTLLKRLQDWRLLTQKIKRRGKFDASTMSGNIWTPPSDLTTWMIPENSDFKVVKSVLSDEITWARGNEYKVGGHPDKIGFSEYAVSYWILQGFNERLRDALGYDFLFTDGSSILQFENQLFRLGFLKLGHYKSEEELFDPQNDILGRGDIVLARLSKNNTSILWCSMFDGNKEKKGNLVSDIIHKEKKVGPESFSLDDKSGEPIRVFRFDNETFKNGELYKQILEMTIPNTGGTGGGGEGFIPTSDTDISRYFTREQLTISKNSAINQPSPEEWANLKEFCENLLDPLQEATKARFGGIRLTSVFRSKAYNSTIKRASTTSAHMEGYAADLHAENGHDDELIAFLKKEFLPYREFDQLLNEYRSATYTSGVLTGIVTEHWIHLGYKHGNRQKRESAVFYNDTYAKGIPSETISRK